MAKTRAARLGYADEQKVLRQFEKIGVKGFRVDKRAGQLGAKNSYDNWLTYPNGKQLPNEQKRKKGGLAWVRKILEGAPPDTVLTVTEPNQKTLVIKYMETEGKCIK